MGIAKLKSQVSASEAHKTLQSKAAREPKTDSRSMAYKFFKPDGLSRAGASRYVRSRPPNTMTCVPSSDARIGPNFYAPANRSALGEIPWCCRTCRAMWL
jgi:hypothetical protein